MHSRGCAVTRAAVAGGSHDGDPAWRTELRRFLFGIWAGRSSPCSGASFGESTWMSASWEPAAAAAPVST